MSQWSISLQLFLALSQHLLYRDNTQGYGGIRWGKQSPTKIVRSTFRQRRKK